MAESGMAEKPLVVISEIHLTNAESGEGFGLSHRYASLGR